MSHQTHIPNQKKILFFLRSTISYYQESSIWSRQN